MTAAVRRALFVGWWVVMTLLPLGHLTGLRNTVTTIVVVATLLWAGRACWRGLPGRWWAVALLAWCAASIGWSAAPGISFGKWRTDLLLPLLAYAAAFGYVTTTKRIEAIVGGMVTGLACLAILSVPALLPTESALRLAASVRTDSFATIVNPMPVWFPGVGDASMAAALSAVGAVLAYRMTSLFERRQAVILAIVLVASLALILVAINNRNATLTIPIVVLLAIWLDRRRSKASVATLRSNRALVATVVVVVAVGALALVESGARERMRQMGTPVAGDESAMVLLTGRDTRPMIWRYYAQLALRAPWAGVGFGRTVPGIAYRTQDDQALSRVEPNAYSHAHNLLLNWWLQTGAVGVLLLLALLGTLAVGAWRAGGEPGTRRRAAASVVMALLATVLLRNMTDDFLIFGMASMFWILVGTYAAVAPRKSA